MTLDAGTYRRARERGIPARSALALARWAVSPPAFDWQSDRNGNDVARFARDGFDITLRTQPDYESGGVEETGALDWGRYSDEAGRKVPDPPVRDAYPVEITTRDGIAWYVSSETLASRVAYYRKAGASRAVALDMARADVRSEAEPWDGQDGPQTVGLTVTASRAGIELGSASLWGIGVGWDDVTRQYQTHRWLDEIAPDLIDEAIEDAKASLARLQTGGTE